MKYKENSLFDASILSQEGRSIVMSFLEEIEDQYCVGEWELEGVHVWPLLKNIAFFQKRQQQNQTRIQENKTIKRVLTKISELAKRNYWTAFMKLRKKEWEKVDFVFSGNFNHRVIWKEKAFNRYFDPIMDYLEGEKGAKSLIFDYDFKKDKLYYREDRLEFPLDYLPYFKWHNRRISFNLDDCQGLKDCIVEIESAFGLPSNYLQIRFLATLRNILLWKALWKYLLKQLQPKGVIVLCYYNVSMYGLNLAASELGILSVDMQHGGQGPLHVAYHFKSIPSWGYNLLPKYFWCWDFLAARNIEEWVAGSDQHKVITGGNPWIDYHKSNSPIGSFQRKVVLYTLQTGIKPYLPPFIIQAIKDSPEDFSWWLRLHPRMRSEEIVEIRRILKKEGINHQVELDLATKEPLPRILSFCFAHFSNSSGCISEAAMMGVPRNVIISGIGKSTFEYLIVRGEAVFFDPEVDGKFWPFLCKMKHVASQSKQQDIPKYVQIFNKFFL